MNRFLSACGLDCKNCECYLATQEHDNTKKEIIAEKWSKQYQAQLTVEDINCDGCMNDGAHFGWCNNCPIRACVVEKEYDSCADCGDFPCSKTDFLYTAVPQAKQNIESLRNPEK